MTRKQAKLEFANVEAEPLGEPGGGWAAYSKTLDQAAVALANEMMGGAQFVLDMSVQYAKDRVQFGRPIGSFQAIKHKCADMLLEVESAKSAAYYASWAAAEDNDELPVVAALAKAYCSEAYFHAAGREHPDPRWHRLHVGAQRAPVLQARQVVGDLPRRRDVPPRAARAAHRHLRLSSPSRRSTRTGASASSAATRAPVRRSPRSSAVSTPTSSWCRRPSASPTAPACSTRSVTTATRSTRRRFTELAEKVWRPGDVRPAGDVGARGLQPPPDERRARPHARSRVPRPGRGTQRDRVHGTHRRYRCRRRRRARVLEALVRGTVRAPAQPGPAAPAARPDRRSSPATSTSGDPVSRACSPAGAGPCSAARSPPTDPTARSTTSS